MPLKKELFVHKLLNRLDRIDRQALQRYLQDIAQENCVLSDILNTIEEGLVWLSRDGEIHFVNKQAALWLDVTEKNAALEIQDIPDSEIKAFIKTNLKNLNEKVVSDLRVLAPHEMTLRVTLLPFNVNSHQDALLILTRMNQDIAASLLDERLRHIESLVQLAAGIAHEIGNPLNSIMIHLQLLKKEAKNLPANRRSNFEKTLEVLNSETSRLDNIIKNFLKATRKPPLRFKSEDLNDIARESLAFMKPELTRHRIQVEFKEDKTLPTFMLDRERIYQALINLIKNAMEAMDSGGTLRIQLSHKNKVVFLRVRDEGDGIPDDVLPHIFEPYFTTKEEGSGLGLMTVFNAIREHGGRIEVTSKVGKGTTFLLFLPIRQPKLQLPHFKK